MVPTFLTARIKELADSGVIVDATKPTDIERALRVSSVRDEFLAALMLNGAHCERFGALRTDLKNQYGYGDDRYPKTIDACLSLLNRWQPCPEDKPLTPSRKTPDKAKEEDQALVFAQDAKKSPKSPSKGSTTSSTGDDSSLTKSNKKTTNVCCRTCGELGHTSFVCPNKPPAQVHVQTADLDDASVTSDTSSVILLTQTILARSDNTRKTIDPNLLLLDSQSTVNLFSNSDLVDNVRTAPTPIKVHCNKGIMPTTDIADFGSNEVYVTKNGIANVLSLFLLGQKHHITYDSKDRGGVFKVHTTNGVIEFTPTSTGLHALDLKAHPDAAHLLVTSSTVAPPPQLHAVTNVHDNFEGFTKKQVQCANEARRIMLMTGVPTERAFESMVRLNQLQDCPITIDDVKNAHLIWGPDLANKRGKTVHRKPDRVELDHGGILQSLLAPHTHVTLVADIIFVNTVPFLVSASRNINLITIEHAPKCTASHLGFLLQCIINVYAWAGFHVHAILMDNEFEKVKDHIPMVIVNTPAVAEHVAEIERRIRTIKERCRGIMCTLPYTALPTQILIHLLHFVVMWLNNSPSATGISSRFSPREIILCTPLKYKQHCRSPLGHIVKSIKTITLPTPWLLGQSPPYASDLQGIYRVRISSSVSLPDSS